MSKFKSSPKKPKPLPPIPKAPEPRKEKPKKGRKSSMLTGRKGVPGELGLGAVGRPEAGALTDKLGG